VTPTGGFDRNIYPLHLSSNTNSQPNTTVILRSRLPDELGTYLYLREDKEDSETQEKSEESSPESLIGGRLHF
jgi:hypothetical protein